MIVPEERPLVRRCILCWCKFQTTQLLNAFIKNNQQIDLKGLKFAVLFPFLRNDSDRISGKDGAGLSRQSKEDLRQADKGLIESGAPSGVTPVTLLERGHSFSVPSISAINKVLMSLWHSLPTGNSMRLTRS
ncbi:MAG: hypothetical protein P8Y63_11325 [Deltaproteobacteria bacterium]